MIKMNPQQEEIIQKTVEFVKEQLSGAEAGHDWWHIYRVWQLSKTIANYEECDNFVVELAVLLHDIADSKFYNGDEEIGPRLAGEFLIHQKVNEQVIDQVILIIRYISFAGGNEIKTYTSNELFVVQDADRLDAMGAI